MPSQLQTGEKRDALNQSQAAFVGEHARIIPESTLMCTNAGRPCCSWRPRTGASAASSEQTVAARPCRTISSACQGAVAPQYDDGSINAGLPQRQRFIKNRDTQAIGPVGQTDRSGFAQSKTVGVGLDHGHEESGRPE